MPSYVLYLYCVHPKQARAGQKGAAFQSIPPDLDIRRDCKRNGKTIQTIPFTFNGM